MKVILTRDVPQVGHDGDIVMVANGYARNYLFPRQLALLAKGGALKSHQRRIDKSEAVSAEIIASAVAQAALIDGKTFQVTVKTGANSTRLFGAVTLKDIHAAVVAKGFDVDRKKMHLADPIKALGTYEVPVKFLADVTATIKVEVTKK